MRYGSKNYFAVMQIVGFIVFSQLLPDRVQAAPPLADEALFYDNNTVIQLLDFGTIDNYVADTKTYQEQDTYRNTVLKDLRKFSPNMVKDFSITKADFYTQNWITDRWERNVWNNSNLAGTELIFAREKILAQPQTCLSPIPPLDESNKLLVWKLWFGSSKNQVKYKLKPATDFFPYSQKGTLQHVNNGLIDNVGKMKNISMWVRASSGKFRISIQLRNNQGDLISFPMGVVESGCWQQLKWEDGFYYEKYQATFNQRPIINGQEIPYLMFDSIVVDGESNSRGHNTSIVLQSISTRYLTKYSKKELSYKNEDDKQWLLSDNYKNLAHISWEKQRGLQVFNLLLEKQQMRLARIFIGRIRGDHPDFKDILPSLQ